MPKMELSIGDIGVGSIEFSDAQEVLAADRTVDGFRLNFPAKIHLIENSTKRQVMAAHLRASVCTVGADACEIGVAQDWTTYVGPTNENGVDVQLAWRGSIAALEFLEKRRATREARLHLDCCIDLGFLDHTGPSAATGLVVTRPWNWRRPVDLCYSRDTWTEMLQKLNVVGNVLVEFPLPAVRQGAWAPVWSALREAREAFLRGGSEGAKASVAAVRLALETWHKMEPENGGAGWVKPSRQDREARTKRERLDALRWHLMQCAHLAPHTAAEDWTRDDAGALLAMLAGLLVERAP